MIIKRETQFWRNLQVLGADWLGRQTSHVCVCVCVCVCVFVCVMGKNMSQSNS